jgi:hypothetical protein
MCVTNEGREVRGVRLQPDLTRAGYVGSGLSRTAVLLSFGCAAATGIFFGYYPAHKAAG